MSKYDLYIKDIKRSIVHIALVLKIPLLKKELNYVSKELDR